MLCASFAWTDRCIRESSGQAWRSNRVVNCCPCMVQQIIIISIRRLNRGSITWHTWSIITIRFLKQAQHKELILEFGMHGRLKRGKSVLWLSTFRIQGGDGCFAGKLHLLFTNNQAERNLCEWLEWRARSSAHFVQNNGRWFPDIEDSRFYISESRKHCCWCIFVIVSGTIGFWDWIVITHIK